MLVTLVSRRQGKQQKGIRFQGLFLGCVGAPLGMLWESLGSCGAALAVLLGLFGGPVCVFWSSLGVLWMSNDGPLGVLGWPWGLLAAAYRSLVAPGSISGIFQEISGGHLATFWYHFGYILRSKINMKM